MGAIDFTKVFHVSSLAQFKRKWVAFAAAHRRTLVREYCKPDTHEDFSPATRKRFVNQDVQYYQAIKKLFETQKHQTHHLSTTPKLPAAPPVPAEQCFLLATQYGNRLPIVKYNKHYFQAINNNQVFEWHLLDLDSPYISDYLMYNGGPAQWHDRTDYYRKQVLAECKPKNDCHNRKRLRAYSPTKASDMLHVRLPGPGAGLTYSVSLAYINLKFTDMDTLLDFAGRIAEKRTHGYVFWLVTNNTTKFVVFGISDY